MPTVFDPYPLHLHALTTSGCRRTESVTLFQMTLTSSLLERVMFATFTIPPCGCSGATFRLLSFLCISRMAWGFLSLLVASFFSHFVGSLSSEALSSSSLIPSGAKATALVLPKATALVLPPPPAEIRLSSGEEIDGSDHKLPPAVAGRPGQLVGLLAQGGLVLRVDDGVDVVDVGLDGGGTQGGRDEDPIPCADDCADCSRRRRRRRTSTWGQAYRTPSR